MTAPRRRCVRDGWPWLCGPAPRRSRRTSGRAIASPDATAAFHILRDYPGDCSRLRCLADSGPPPRVAGWWTARKPSAAQIAVLCQGADVVVIKANMTAACPGALVLTGADFARGGAAELYRTRAGWKIVWAQTERGLRPWSSSGTGG